MIRDTNIDLLAVQETHLTEDLAKQFTDIFGNTLSLIHSPDPQTNNARGIALVINKKKFRTQDVTNTVVVPGRALLSTIPWQNNQSIRILAVYAPNIPSEIRDFWKTIQNTITTDPSLSPDIVLGDFNMVEDAIDRLPTRSDDARATSALLNFRSKFSLIDGWRKAHPTEKGYSWLRDSDGTQSRIDRIYIREEFFGECKEWSINPPPIIPTDHDLITARISTPSTPVIGRGRWAIPTRIFKNKLVKTEIQALGNKLENDLRSLNGRSQQRNPQTLLKEFKTRVINLARANEKRTQPMIREKIKKLFEQLQATRNNSSLSQDEIKLTSTKLKKEIQSLEKDTHQYKRNRNAAIDAAEGECIGKTWSRRFQNNKPRDTINCLKDPATNEVTRDSKKMARIAAKYHEDLQSLDCNPQAPPNRQRLNAILYPIKAKLSPRNKATLAEPITEDEIRYAISKTPNDKAPGPDGIPIEFWKLLADQHAASKDDQPHSRKCDIVWILTQVFLDIEENGMDHIAGLNEGCISPIYKKKDPENIANYRPITLLNTDYKIFTKALSLKLADTAPEVINHDQAGFLKNRSIFDQVKTSKLVIDYMERTNKPGAIVALDQEKAYDKILHPYLWEILHKLNFPERFINTVKALYDNAATRIMINGELSDPFLIIRGVRQGDALSCLLFDLAIEPLAENIRKSQLLKGINIPCTKKSLKVKMFADDTTVFLSEEDSMNDLQNILTNWCEVSGAKFNIEKTEIIPLGNDSQRRNTIATRKLGKNSSPLPPNIHIAKDGEPVRILGAWLGTNVDQETTWAPIMENCVKRLKTWSAAKHSLNGRRLILQMQVAGVTQYLTKVQGMPKNIENDLKSLIKQFTWNYEKTDTVNHPQMCAPFQKGGKKVLDIEARNKAIHLTWLKTYLNIGEDRATWTYFADAIIATDIPKTQNIADDPEARIMPFLQTWTPRQINSDLPDDLQNMLKLAREYNVRVDHPNPGLEVKINLPIWYHIHSDPSARKLYKKKTAKCLRKNHDIKLVKDALSLLEKIPNTHRSRINCACELCKTTRAANKCPHPHECLKLTAALISKITPKWNPTTHSPNANPPTTHPNHPGEDGTIQQNNEATSLKDVITIFNPPVSHPTAQPTPPLANQ